MTEVVDAQPQAVVCSAFTEQPIDPGCKTDHLDAVAFQVVPHQRMGNTAQFVVLLQRRQFGRGQFQQVGIVLRHLNRMRHSDG